MAPRTHIAVIGGGISGLSTAWYLAKAAPPTVTVTLLEATKRTGGWLHSDRVKDPIQDHHGGSLLLEYGPRSLRPQGASGLNTLELVKDLKLESRLEPILKTSPAAMNRFIYSRNKLHMLPNTLAGALSHPLILPKLPRASLDLIRGGSGREDESIQEFVTRRFGKAFSDDLISAMVHGIYAGDASKLSLRSTFGILYQLEKDFGSVILGMLMGGSGSAETAWDRILKEKILHDAPDLKDFIDKTSIYSFKDGIEELAKAMEHALIQSGRVNILKHNPVEKLEFDGANRNVKISIASKKDPIKADMVIATVPPPVLNKMLPNHYSELSHNPSANVAVVNLVYDAAKAQLPTPGFGYLIPRSENSAQNHKGLLGVVFDSCATPGQDTGPSNGNVIKLTAMIGGYMFDEVASTQHLSPAATEGHSSSEVGNAKKYSPISKGFEKDQVRRLELFFKEVATDAVMNHLNIETEPELVRVHIQHNCIPQYLVGHLQRMQSLDEALRRDFDGMLAVTGAGYLGVSVNDCIKNAREVVEAIVSKLDEEDSGEAELVGKQDAVTGLERASK